MKRTPLKRRTPLRRAARRPIARADRCLYCRQPRYAWADGTRAARCAEHLADLLVRTAVLLRDGYRCRRCGDGHAVEWAHVVPGRREAVKWRLDASLALCAPCHRWTHEHPDAGAELFRSLGFDVDGLRFASMHGEPEDPRDVIERLAARSEEG